MVPYLIRLTPAAPFVMETKLMSTKHVRVGHPVTPALLGNFNQKTYMTYLLFKKSLHISKILAYVLIKWNFGAKLLKTHSTLYSCENRMFYLVGAFFSANCLSHHFEMKQCRSKRTKHALAFNRSENKFKSMSVWLVLIIISRIWISYRKCAFSSFSN